MRAFAFAALLLVAGCSKAADDRATLPESGKTTEEDVAEEIPADPDDVAGVWRGTIGKLPVMACINAGENVDRGAYYYLAKLKPITLRTGEGQPRGTYAEQFGYDDPTGATWTVKRASSERLAGEWRKDGKSLPIALRAVEYSLGEYQQACEAGAFMAPRIAGWKITSESARIGGAVYTRLDWRPGKAFDADSASVASFALDGSRPGDKAINRALRAALPGDDPEHELYGCMASNLAWQGTDGYWDQVIQPEVISPGWVATIDAIDLYCGGAHPDTSQTRRVYDRRTGKEVDPAQFLKRDAYELYDFEPEVGRVKAPVQHLSKPLRDVVRARWPKENEECAVSLDDGGIDIGLARRGMVFKPDVPHVAAPCGESITVPWSELAPFLSEKGQSVRASFEK